MFYTILILLSYVQTKRKFDLTDTAIDPQGMLRYVIDPTVHHLKRIFYNFSSHAERQSGKLGSVSKHLDLGVKVFTGLIMVRTRAI